MTKHIECATFVSEKTHESGWHAPSRRQDTNKVFYPCLAKYHIFENYIIIYTLIVLDDDDVVANNVTLFFCMRWTLVSLRSEFEQIIYDSMHY